MLKELPKKALRNLFGGNISTTQVLQTVATGMADCGVDVLIDPRITVPMADPKNKRIYLPTQVRSERALLVVSWYLDHESAHIIYTPDLRPTIERWRKEGPVFDVCVADGYTGVPEPLLAATKGVLNITEDSRIEHLLSKRLPGCKKHFLNGPVAAGLENLVEDIYEKSLEIQEATEKDHAPLSPFWVAEMHAYAILDGWHGQKSKQYARNVLPEHVHWVMDIIDDEFGDIRDVTNVTFDSLVDRTETAMAKIIKRVLDESEEIEGDGGKGEDQQESPFQDEFNKSKGEGDGEGEGDESEGEGDPSKGGKSKPKKEQEDEDETSDAGGSEDEDDGGGESDGDSDESSNDEGEDSEDESDESDDGSGSGEQGESEGSQGSSSSDESDDDGSDGSESGDEDEDSDSDSEEQSDGGDDNGSEDSEGDDGDDSGESDSGSGDEVDDESEDEDEGDEAEDSGDTGPEDSSMDGEDNGEDGGEGEEEEESHLEEGDGQPKQLPKQVEEWAEEADMDMADLIRQGGESGMNEDAQSSGSGRPKAGGSPTVEHEATQDGMPEKYYEKLAPGLRSIVIDGVDMTNFVDTSDTFKAYDDFVRSLMPPNLGPAARKLVGKFKGAPGPAYAGNRVNPRLLAPIVAGKAGGRPLMLRRNDTVYSRKGVAVMLLLDCSGSMCDTMRGLELHDSPTMESLKQIHGYSWRDFASKFVISHAAIRSLSRVFQSSGVPFAVGGFTTADPKHTNRNYGGDYSRGFDIVNLMFKDFHEPWASSEQKMIAMNPFTNINYKGDEICSHANSDGESVLWAATRLLQREEDIKVLIVASDGLPAGGGSSHYGCAFLKYVVNRLEVADIHVGALGIGNEGCKHYYRVHELIDHFPEGHGDQDTAPLYVQDKVIRLVDRLMTEGGNPNGAR